MTTEFNWHIAQLIRHTADGVVTTAHYTIDASDLQFLMRIAANSGNAHSDYANTAIRLLGTLLDEGLASNYPRIAIHSLPWLLSILLDHPDPSRRYYAVKALWQGRVVSSVNDLHRRMKVEDHPLVKRVTEQAIEVLDRYATAP